MARLADFPPALRGGGAALACASLLLAAPGQGRTWPSVPFLSAVTIPDWSYTKDSGPQHWAELAPTYRPCGGGQRQSPIDLRAPVLAPRKRLSYHYRSSPLSLANNGRTVWGDEGAGSYLIIGERRYELTRYQFHTPSEHLRHGRRAEMEIQLQHRDRQGNIAMLAVLVEAGRGANTTLQRIADHLPAPGDVFYGRHVGINPVFMLPSDRAHFAYPGSLTTPPCTEGVDWRVLREPLVLDARLLARFRQAMGDNARPLQPRNGRPLALHRRP